MEIRQHFTEHPASVGETYGEHFEVAVGFAGSLAIAAVAAAVHAVVPSRCEKTASKRIIAMYERMTTGARVGNLPGDLPGHLDGDIDVVADHVPATNRPVAAA